MSYLVDRPSPAELQAFFDLLLAAFQHAAETSQTTQDVYQFGGLHVKIRFRRRWVGSDAGASNYACRPT